MARIKEAPGKNTQLITLSHCLITIYRILETGSHRNRLGLMGPQ